MRDMLRTLMPLICAWMLPAAAQHYPSKPIRIIVGYAAGGGNDLIVRVMAPRMAEGLGQPVIIENKPGAQAIIATEYAAKAPPDGYTVLMGPTGPMTMNSATYAKLPYDPVRDVPTLAEAGVRDVEVWLWTAFFAPARTSSAIVARLRKETARVVRLPDVAAGLAKLGVDPVGGSSEELASRLARDLAKWTAVAKAANIRND